jgi:activating signal cointegrator complex subunit 3
MDQNLKLTLAFGIALHHAGLNEKDRKLVEELFVNSKVQILIATSTLAWGVNFPAHLVIVKGTEFYDGKTKRYVDFPITDVLQMMGRAGRPQFDDQGTAVIMVHDVKKHFYKKFLYEPFPVESSLLAVLSDHLNAEIVASTITTKQEAMDYLTWTYFFRRLLVNPSYYELESLEHDQINSFLSSLIQKTLDTLEDSYCIQINDEGEIAATSLGRIASYYYLSHLTVKNFKETLDNQVLSDFVSSNARRCSYEQQFELVNGLVIRIFIFEFLTLVGGITKNIKKSKKIFKIWDENLKRTQNTPLKPQKSNFFASTLRSSY